VWADETDQELQMPELKGSQTEANLRAAFAFESEASRRFLYFAQQADVEGRPEAAAVFRTAAEGESGHALGHLDFLVDVGDPATGMVIGSTDENLASAAAGELDEAKRIYPDFAAVARAEGFGDIADWLESLAGAEAAHAERFNAAGD
jgi:rubrerythrin